MTPRRAPAQVSPGFMRVRLGVRLCIPCAHLRRCVRSRNTHEWRQSGRLFLPGTGAECETSGERADGFLISLLSAAGWLNKQELKCAREERSFFFISAANFESDLLSDLLIYKALKGRWSSARCRMDCYFFFSSYPPVLYLGCGIHTPHWSRL